jgi:GNAT superfamily N-acetyltransferase
MIRPAEPRDLAQLVAMIEGLAAHHGDASSVTEADLARDLFGPAPWLHILVDEERDLRGYAALTQLARLQYGQRGMDLHHLYVCTEARGAGLGKALLAASVDFARSQGCRYMTVSALPDNTAAQAFYGRNGFHLAPVSGVRFALDLAGKG